MSPDAKPIDSLTALYMNQSPLAFTAFASHAKAPNDYSKRVDDGEHSGITKCDYPCCDENGCCSSAGWYIVLGGCVVCCFACCCYITGGFNGAWTYWPF